MNKDKRVFVTFTKVDEKEHMVYGYASTESIDSQGEVVTKDAIREALDDFMRFANMREMHQPSAVGKVKQALLDETGLFIGAKIVDKTAWEKVVEGVYNGFSIGGQIVEKIGHEIKRLILQEISLVDRPSNPDAVFSIIKLDTNNNNMKTEEVKKDAVVKASKEVIKEDEEKEVVESDEKLEEGKESEEGTKEGEKEEVEAGDEDAEVVEEAVKPSMQKMFKAELTKYEERVSKLEERLSKLEKGAAPNKAKKSYATIEKSVAGDSKEMTAEEIKKDLRQKINMLSQEDVLKLDQKDQEKLFSSIR